VFKVIGMMKRKPGMTRAQFRDYYETHHAPMGDLSMANAKRYLRRYLHPFSEITWSESLQKAMVTLGGEDVLGKDDTAFDVITEIWFATQSDFEQAFLAMGTPEYLAKMAQLPGNAINFMDLQKSRMFTLEDHESWS
jgi:EthD domain